MDDRAHREKEIYNKQTIKRNTYINFFRSSYFCSRYIDNAINIHMQEASNKDVLEIGSNAFIGWIVAKKICPKTLTCINIAEKELEIGTSFIKNNPTDFPIELKIMDANKLDFQDDSFDIVFGGAILHHLNFKTAIKEIHRILRPNGKIVFHEPLRMNPFALLVRMFTPFARTPDERPLGSKEIEFVKKYYNTKIYYNQLFSVASACLTGVCNAKPENIFDKITFKIDRKISEFFPFFNMYYREAILTGEKKLSKED